MIKDFNISEKGHGSYWLLGHSLMGDGPYLYFVRHTEIHARVRTGHRIYISNSPFVSWLSIFGIRGEAYLLGIVELKTAAILTAGAFIPILSALGRVAS